MAMAICLVLQQDAIFFALPRDFRNYGVSAFSAIGTKACTADSAPLSSAEPMPLPPR